MEKEILHQWVKAGKIAAQALTYGRSLIKEGALVREVLDKIEEKILTSHGEIAFPVQISLNETAAHGCADQDDQTILKDQVVKLDLGVHLNGYVADTALTVDLSRENGDLVKASQKALAEAIKITKPGIKLGEIGAIIEETIHSFGFKPVKNLSGHGLGKFVVHDHPSIPNFNNNSRQTLEENQIIAIETFASQGAGLVVEKGEPLVFMQIKDFSLRDPISQRIGEEIKNYQNLPFTKRWLVRKFNLPQVNFVLRRLRWLEAVREFPPLVDVNKGLVSQAEHSLIIKEKPIILTEVD